MARRPRKKKVTQRRQEVPQHPKGDPHSVDPSYEVVPILEGYLLEAQTARQTGLNPRDDKWEENLHLYWNRHDHSRKAAWQAKESMPEVPTFVDRFAAALKEALVASQHGFYTIHDPAVEDDNFSGFKDAVKRATDAWLSTCGYNQLGHPLSFAAVFEEQVKLGAMTAMSAVVTWKEDDRYKYGRVCVETQDPRRVWLDPTFRSLYRVRRIELDKHELWKMARQLDKKGRPIWNLDGIASMIRHIEAEDERRKEEMSGHGHEQISTRQPVILDEYYCDVIDSRGNVIAERALCVVGNRSYLIRGPEPNPFWHGCDWYVYCPLVITPLSVYGRSYMEDFGSVAKTFNSLTNLILDAIHTSSLKAFALAPSLLLNPSQVNEGLHPNKLFLLEDGVTPQDFWAALDLGSLPSESVQVWQAIKNELREAADINEVGLGQFAPKSRTSATEISTAQESSNALIRSVAQTIEQRFLNPILDLVWKTGMQHVKRDDPVIRAAIGPELFEALLVRRKELVQRQITFQAQGISLLIQKSRMLRAVLTLFQILAQSELLLQEFLKIADMQKLVRLLFDLADVDLKKIEISQQQRMINDMVQQFQQAGARAEQATAQPGQSRQEPDGGTRQQLQGIAQQLGVAA